MMVGSTFGKTAWFVAALALAVSACRSGGKGDDGDGATDGSDSDGGDDGPGTACESSRAPRQLRLLTRREYNATVIDLFGLDPDEPCTGDAVCGGGSCQDGTCVDEVCSPHTFVLAGQPGWSSVHVAGSFNDWPGTIAAGGLALEFQDVDGSWQGSLDLPPGRHEYKFVIDESNWIPDPGNPMSVPDGLGGQNSVVEIACTQVPRERSFDPAADFPVESRPQGYGFDNAAASGLVTSVHVQQYLGAAQTVAERALEHPDRWLPCAAVDGGCAETFVRDVGRRVFRRPLSDAEVGKYLGLVGTEASVSDGIAVALRAMLSSPLFLYRSEIGTADGDHHVLDGYEVAASLSYTLWGTTPDDALLEAAASGALATHDGREAQARRLVGDARAREVVGVFALQWLGVERVLTATKNSAQFPQFDDHLRASLAAETRQFIDHVVFDGSGRFEELLLADFGFVNEALATLYGIEDIAGPELRMAALPSELRVGLLGHGSILASYAHPDQTSPVRRGLFVREHLLCQQLPPPPPDAGMVPEIDPNATTRERFRQHSEDPACRGCHVLIDEVGFGFERFDPIGGYRDTENEMPIDASGNMNDVEALGDGTDALFSTLPELAQILAGASAPRACFARQYFRFTHGRLDDDTDQCAVDELADAFAAAGGDIREMMVAIVTHPSFVERR